MPDAYRDETEAALQRAEALRRENDELRQRLARAERAATADARIAALQQENAALRARVGDLLSAARPVPAPMASGAAGAAGLGALAVLLAAFVGMAAHRPAAPAVMLYDHAGRPAYQQLPDPARSTELRAVASNQPGVLGIRVAPGNARRLDVTVDGAAVPMVGGHGLTEPLEPGRAHLLQVRAEGFRPMSTSVWVPPGQVETFNVRLFPLEPAPASSPRR